MTINEFKSGNNKLVLHKAMLGHEIERQITRIKL